jgi:acetyl-CoA acetyltransferase
MKEGKHLDQYGSTEEDFGAMAIARRGFAVKNPTEPLCHDELTMADCLNSRCTFTPLHLLACDYQVDSSSAIIFTTDGRGQRALLVPVRP